MRRAIFPLLLLLSALCSGCALPGGSSGGTTLTIWYGTDDPAERVWSSGLTRVFQASHPGLHVRLIDYSFVDLNTKLQLALSAGNPPDLAYVTPRGPGIPAYVSAHRLRDLTAAARRYHWADRLGPGLLRKYNQPFGFLGARRGSVVAVPTSLAAVALLYNRSLLTQLGLAPPQTLPALETALHRARAAGYIPLGLGNADGWLGDDWYLTLANALAGPATLAPEQRLDPHFSFRRPALLNAARTLRRWAVAGYFTPDFGSLDAQEGIDQFFAGKTLFQLVSSSENAQIVADLRQTRLAVGVLPFPGAAGRPVVPVSGYLGWVIPAAAAHPAEATAFITSLLSASTQRFLFRQGLLPASLPWQVRHGGTTHRLVTGFPAAFARALQGAEPGVYLDAAPVPNLNATMEANVQLLLQGYETPQFLVNSLQQVYRSRGRGGSTARIDGEF